MTATKYANEGPRALVHLGSLALGARALARELLGGAESAVDGWMSSLLGEDFASRLGRVPLTLTSRGTDPFGLDPQWTKWALSSVAFRFVRAMVELAPGKPSDEHRRNRARRRRRARVGVTRARTPVRPAATRCDLRRGAA